MLMTITIVHFRKKYGFSKASASALDAKTHVGPWFTFGFCFCNYKFQFNYIN